MLENSAPAQPGMTWGTSKSLASISAILNSMIPVIPGVVASFSLPRSVQHGG
jgi:hypothetical protein